MSTFPIVIIGAGPAGIATAVEAINRGFKSEEIILIEKSGEIAHMISKKYPDEKAVLANYKGKMAACLGDMCITDMTKADFFDYLETVVTRYGLHINFHQQVQKIVKLRNGQFNVETNADTYTCSAVFIAIGNMAAPRGLGAPIDLKIKDHVFYDIQNVKAEYKDVLVIGGGDSAGEYAKILHERGHNVSISYRGENFTRMIEKNAQDLNELVNAKKCIFLKASEIAEIKEKAGYPYVAFKDDKYPAANYHCVVTALGTERPTNYLNAIGINTETESGDLFLESKMPGLFFVGDLASGRSGGTINFAFNSGVKAVEQACYSYLDCKLPGTKKDVA